MRWPAFVGILAFVATFSIFRATRDDGAVPRVSSRTLRGVHLRALHDSILRADLREGLPARAARLSPPVEGLVVVARDSAGVLRRLPDSTLRPIRYAWGRAVGGTSRVPALLIVDDVTRDPLVTPTPERGGVCTIAVWFPDAAYRDGPLGPCAWYARLGMPSDPVAAWLDSTGVLPSAAPAGFIPTDSTLRDYARRYAALGVMAPLTGMTAPAYTAAPPAVRCAAGDLAACLPAAMASDSVRGIDGFWSYWGRPAGLGGYERYLLRDLDREFGPDRLAAFWHSPRPVPEAFRSAFGVPLDRWLAPHLSDHLGTLELGAGRLGMAAVSALIWTLLLGGFGWLAARRLRY
jgi:hypothetical protein